MLNLVILVCAVYTLSLGASTEPFEPNYSRLEPCWVPLSYGHTHDGSVCMPYMIIYGNSGNMYHQQKPQVCWHQSTININIPQVCWHEYLPLTSINDWIRHDTWHVADASHDFPQIIASRRHGPHPEERLLNLSLPELQMEHPDRTAAGFVER